MNKHKSRILSAILILVSVVIALLIGEALLRLLFVGDDAGTRYYVMPPNLKKIFRPQPEVMPGINGESRFVTNSDGMRADPYPDGDVYRILTFGGSTTECLYLDQMEAWPRLVQEQLELSSDKEIWVGNVGTSGRNTRHHVLQVEELLKQYRSIDLIVLLVGVNDMSLRLQQDREFSLVKDKGNEFRQLLMDFAFAIHPSSEVTLPFFKRTEIWRMLRKIRSASRGPIQDNAGNIYREFRRNRLNASEIVDTLPDLSFAVDEYTQNIYRILDTAEKYGVRVILMTQPSMWRRDLPSSLDKLLWFGKIGYLQNTEPKRFYSVTALERAMEIYNETLLEVCDLRKVDCINLASVLPKDSTAFFDDVHFNESGAGMVADAVSQYLIDNDVIIIKQAIDSR